MTSRPTSQTDCRDRLLEAARRVFASEGVRGATTRAIAREAGVNEVTLFRHFESKLKLLVAVLNQRAEEQMAALQCHHLDDLPLAEALRVCAEVYDEVLTEDEGLLRTVIGETHRNPECARTIAHEAVAPWKKRLRELLQKRQAAGEIRADLSIAPAVDMFTGTLLAGMLKRTSPWRPRDYTRDDYLRTSVEIFLQGIRADRADR